jgi:RHS repeat-associated protein
VRRDVDVTSILNPKKTPVTEDLIGNTYVYTAERGWKLYELTNHLGNVLVAVTDKKNGVPSSGNSSLIDHYTADVVSAGDYYPFGMLMPGRKFESSEYRYGFNGKERDNEVKGEGAQYDYGFRIYDPRTGQWLSIDPLASKYPAESPYLYTGGNPIFYADPDGRDRIVTITRINKDGSYTQLRKVEKGKFFYNEQYGVSGGTTYTKANIFQNFTIDLRNNKITNEISIGAEKEISSSEYHGRYIFPEVGDLSNTVQYGFRIYGKGKESNWQKGLPTASRESESIDLGSFLDLVGNMREAIKLEPSALATNPLVKRIYDTFDGIADAVEATATAIAAVAETTAKASTDPAASPKGEGLKRPYKDFKKGSSIHVRGDQPGQNRRVLTDSTLQCCEVRPAQDTFPKKRE